jgi:Uncharacterized protein conserved in bacteria
MISSRNSLHPTRAAMLNGLRSRCPNCGEGPLYARYLQPVAKCGVCGETLGDEYQVGLLLPFIVITVVGHVLVFVLLELARAQVNPLVSLAILIPVVVIGSLLLLPPVKGALIGLLWARNLSDQER